MAMSDEAKERLRQKTQPIRDRIEGKGRGGGRQERAHYVALSGQNAIVQPGGSVIVRFLPRWDIKQMYKLDPKTRKMVLDPNYQSESEEIAVQAIEHWYDTPAGKTQRDWCRKMLGENEPCAPDELAAALYASGKPADKEYANRIRARIVYLYNVIVRKQFDPEVFDQQRNKKGMWVDKQYTEDGKPDIRILCVGETIWVKLNDIMSGGPGGGDYAYGEIFDISGEEGRDMQIFRPSAQGQQYDVKAAPKTSRLYEKGDTRWNNWMDLLHPLPEEIAPDKIRSYEVVYQLLNGRPPDRGASSQASYTEPEGFPDTGYPEPGDDSAPGDGQDLELRPYSAGAPEPFSPDEGFEFPGEPGDPGQVEPEQVAPQLNPRNRQSASTPRIAAPPVRQAPSRTGPPRRGR